MEPTDVLVHRKAYDTSDLRDKMLINDKFEARILFRERLMKGEYSPILNQIPYVNKLFKDELYITEIRLNVFKPS